MHSSKACISNLCCDKVKRVEDGDISITVDVVEMHFELKCHNHTHTKWISESSLVVMRDS